MVFEEGKMEVDGLILRNQPRATVLWLVIKMREEDRGVYTRG